MYGEMVQYYCDKIGCKINVADQCDGWFNPELSKIALDKMLYSVNCDVFFNSDVISVKKSKDKVLGIEILFNGLSLYIVSRYFIDATGDGNFSQLLNCKKLKYNSKLFLDNLNNKTFVKKKDKKSSNLEKNVRISCSVKGCILKVGEPLRGFNCKGSVFFRDYCSLGAKKWSF